MKIRNQRLESFSTIHSDRESGPHPIASRGPDSSQDDLLTVAHCTVGLLSFLEYKIHDRAVKSGYEL